MDADKQQLKNEIRQEVIQELKAEFQQDIAHVKHVFEELIQRQKHLVQQQSYDTATPSSEADTSLEPIRQRLQELNEALDRIKRNLD